MSLSESHPGQEGKEVPQKTQVIFYGISHDPLNLEIIGPVVDSFRRSLEQSFGRNVIYLENATLDRKGAKVEKELVKSYGLVLIPLLNVLNERKIVATQISVELLHMQINSLGRDNLNILIKSELLPSKHVRYFFLFQELDSLGRRYSFDVESESHSRKTLKEIVKFRGELNSVEEETLKFWNEGALEQAIERLKTFYKRTNHMLRVRDTDIIRDLKGIIHDLAKEGKGGTLFIVLGEGHVGIIETLKRDLSQDAPYVEFETIRPYVGSNILDNLREGNEITDELYAQDLLRMFMLGRVREYFTDKKDYKTLANNFDTIHKTICEVVITFPLEEIRELCKSKKDLLDVLRVHSRAVTILPYISRLII